MEHDRALDEEHWSYMDGFADGMIARGPTLAPDRATWTGSLHILDLPSANAAREFVEREPYKRAVCSSIAGLREQGPPPDFTALPRERVIVHVSC